MAIDWDEYTIEFEYNPELDTCFREITDTIFDSNIYHTCMENCAWDVAYDNYQGDCDQECDEEATTYVDKNNIRSFSVWFFGTTVPGSSDPSLPDPLRVTYSLGNESYFTPGVFVSQRTVDFSQREILSSQNSCIRVLVQITYSEGPCAGPAIFGTAEICRIIR